MDALNIKCPCCKAVISVSRESGQILHVEEYKKGPAEFSSFLEKQKSRKDDLARKFEASKEKTKTRLQAIEEKIAFAKKRVDESGDTSRPPNPLDQD
jgi:Zn-finger nucleic acid-binding protein